MPVPVWVLLGFAGWTLGVLLGTVGLYRWSRILTRRAEIRVFRADAVQDEDWYRRAMRAHANCVENLPVYAAIVVAALAAGVDTPLLDGLALALLGARVVQSVVHIAFEETSAAVSVRFAFFFVQLVCMAWMGVYVAMTAG